MNIATATSSCRCESELRTIFGKGQGLRKQALSVHREQGLDRRCCWPEANAMASRDFPRPMVTIPTELVVLGTRGAFEVKRLKSLQTTNKRSARFEIDHPTFT
jgi:hypothetical protein